jgi:hypothetical protein
MTEAVLPWQEKTRVTEKVRSKCVLEQATGTGTGTGKDLTMSLKKEERKMTHAMPYSCPTH